MIKKYMKNYGKKTTTKKTDRNITKSVTSMRSY